MNILVCVKQVPDTTEIQIDSKTHTLIRDNVPSILNPFDAFALELAIRLKEKDQGIVTVLSMGPEQSKIMLKKCLAVGADSAYLACDNVFGGSDTLATSYILSAAVKAIEEKTKSQFDLVLCGKQAIDGDTGQVGPALAEFLRYAHITYASQISCRGGRLEVKRQMNYGYDILSCAMPVVVTVTTTPFDLRFPSLKGRLESKKKAIDLLSSDELSLDLAKCGLRGSPTRVIATFTPTHHKNCVRVNADSVQKQTDQLAAMLRDCGAL